MTKKEIFQPIYINIFVWLLITANSCSFQLSKTKIKNLIEALQYERLQKIELNELNSISQKNQRIAVSHLIGELNAEREEIRYSAAISLGIIGNRYPLYIPSIGQALEKALGEDSPKVRSCAAIALGRIGAALKNPADLVTVLLAATSDPHPEVRDAATIGLARIGTKDPRVIPGLIRSMEDENGAVRDTGAEVLAGIGLSHPEVIIGFLAL